MEPVRYLFIVMRGICYQDNIIPATHVFIYITEEAAALYDLLVIY